MLFSSPPTWPPIGSCHLARKTSKKSFEGFCPPNPHDWLKGHFPSPKRGTHAALKGFVGPQNKNNEQKRKRIMKTTINCLPITSLFRPPPFPRAIAADVPFRGAFQA